MAVTLQCPRCTHQQTVDDDKVGKEIPCKICHHLIKPAGAQDKPKSKLASPEKGPAQEGVMAGAPSATGAKKTAPARDAGEKRPAPRSRRKQEESSSTGLVMILMGAGVFVMLALVCGGGSLGMYFLFRSDDRADIPVAQNDQPAPVPENDPGPQPGPGPQPWPEQQPFPVQPFQPPQVQPQPFQPPPQPEVLDPNNANHLDRVVALLRGPAQQRPPAYTWLVAADPNRARRREVARLLEGLVDEELNNPFTQFFNAYFRWATKDNVATLMRFAESKAFSPGDNDRRQRSMLALGNLKEAPAADNIVSKLGNPFDGDTAYKALMEMGPVAQDAVLKAFNHADVRVRDKARNLLQGYGAKTEVLFAQCLADLDDADAGRRGGALQWLAKSPVEEKRKTEVSSLLNKSLDSPDCLRNNDLVAVLENWGTSENVAKLAEILDKSQFGNGAAIRILGKIRDPNGIKAVVKSASNFFNQQEAKKVLKDNGAIAEPLLITAMNATTDSGARRMYVSLLEEIGTKNVSGPALFQLAQRSQQDRLLLLHIQRAQMAINARGR